MYTKYFVTKHFSCSIQNPGCGGGRGLESGSSCTRRGWRARPTLDGRTRDARGRRLSVETALNVGRRLRRDQLLRRGGPYLRQVSNMESKLH